MGQTVLTLKHHLHSATMVKKLQLSLLLILEDCATNHQTHKKMNAKTSTMAHPTLVEAVLFVSPKPPTISKNSSMKT